MDRLRERPSLHGELSSPYAPLVHVERVGMHSPPFLKFLTNLIKNDFETNKCRRLLQGVTRGLTCIKITFLSNRTNMQTHFTCHL
jgi:hypothetical protein